MTDLQQLESRLAECHREFQECARELGQTQSALAYARKDTAALRIELDAFKSQRAQQLEKELESLRGA